MAGATKQGMKRQKECQKISRKRKQRQQWQSTRTRLAWLCGGTLAFYIISATAWFAYTGGFGRTANAVMQSALNYTVSLGYKVNYVYLDGRKDAPREAVIAAIDVNRGEPILGVSVSAIHARLVALPRVRSARVERVFPDRIYVHIDERQPIAVWQYQGKLQLVDADGVVMREPQIERYRHLPLLVGEGAPTHAAQLLGFMYKENNLAQQVQSAIYVGERRWNIRFKNGMELKLPEEKPQDAWQRFAALEREENLLAKDIRAVDMRLPDRMFIKLPQPATPPAPTGPASET